MVYSPEFTVPLVAIYSEMSVRQRAGTESIVEYKRAVMANLRKSTLWSVAEFACVVLIQLFVMRYIVVVLGVRALGIWSVLMSAAQIARFFDLGASAGMGRFLAIAAVDGNIGRIENILATIIYITIPMYGSLSAVLYFPLHEALAFALKDQALVEGRDLLIYALCSYVAQVLSSAFASSLTGLHLGFRKSQISIAGMTIQAILTLTWIRRFGLPGLAIAQIANYSFTVFMSVLVLKMGVGVQLRGLLRFHWETIRRIMSFGVGIQASSIAWGAFETSIRFIMSRFGGVEQVGTYEIAYKVSSQARVLAFYVSQSLGPMFASLGARDKPKLVAFYRQVYARYALFAAVVTIAIIVFSPLTSLIMLGRINWVFLVFSALTALGAMAHIVASPSELTAISLGLVRYNVAGTVTALIVMLLFGPLLGYFFHGLGVAGAVLLAALIAVSIPLFFNNGALNLPRLPSFRRDLDLAGLIQDIRSPSGR
jgi:O-antigen/teichoic acid export membrane protein